MVRRAVLGVALLIGCTPFTSDRPTTTAPDGSAPDAAPNPDPPGVDGGRADAYAAAVLADQPLLYWRLGEASGDFLDASGRGHLGRSTAVGRSEAALVSGAVDPSIRLSPGQSVDSVTASDLDFVGNAPYTLECWVRVDAVPTGDADILARADLDSGVGLFIEGNSSKVIASRYEVGNGTNHGGRELTLGEPHHVVTTYDGTSLRLYIDGANANELTKNAAKLAAHPFPVTLGRSVSGEARFNGWIDEVAIYGSALGEDRIAAHAQLGRK